MKYVLKLSFTLLLITALVATALAGVNAVTKDRIAAVQAQKISDATFKAKLEKSNAEIANPKKSSKSATWFNRGKICADAIMAPTKGFSRTVVRI